MRSMMTARPDPVETGDALSHRGASVSHRQPSLRREVRPIFHVRGRTRCVHHVHPPPRPRRGVVRRCAELGERARPGRRHRPGGRRLLLRARGAHRLLARWREHRARLRPGGARRSARCGRAVPHPRHLPCRERRGGARLPRRRARGRSGREASVPSLARVQRRGDHRAPGLGAAHGAHGHRRALGRPACRARAGWRRG